MPGTSRGSVRTLPEGVERRAPDDDGPRPWSGGGRDELAAAVRRLVAATVTSAMPPDGMARATAALEAVATDLEGCRPDDGSVPRGRFADRTVPAGEAPSLADAMPFDVVIGSCNPLAVPLTVEFEPTKAVARATFTAPYEGAPGCVHGAVLAGAFDIVLTAANVLADAAGPTVSLTIRYLRPTVIDRPAVFEAWATSVEGRRVRSRGHLIQAGVVTVEAEGEFAVVARDRIASMHRYGGGGDGGNHGRDARGAGSS